MAGYMFEGEVEYTHPPLSPASQARLSEIASTPKRVIIAQLIAENVKKYGPDWNKPANRDTSNASSSMVVEHTSTSSHTAGSATNSRPPKKPRKPYTCSEKHNAHNRRQKEEGAQKWRDNRKHKTKCCYVCKQVKPTSEFTRKYQRCIACTDSPEYPAAYAKLCEARGWKLPQWQKSGFVPSSGFAKVPEADK
jgi:hypothetical protein